MPVTFTCEVDMLSLILIAALVGLVVGTAMAALFVLIDVLRKP